MTTKALAVVATKLTGIVCLVIALSRVPNLFRLYMQSVDLRVPGVGLLPFSAGCSFVLITAAGLLLLFMGDQIGGFISKSDTGMTSSCDADDFLAIGIALAGAWIMATALPAALERLAVAVIYNKMGFADLGFSGERKAGFFGYAFQFGVGLWMFLGSRGLVGFRNRMQGSPAQPTAQP